MLRCGDDERNIWEVGLFSMAVHQKGRPMFSILSFGCTPLRWTFEPWRNGSYQELAWWKGENCPPSWDSRRTLPKAILNSEPNLSPARKRLAGQKCSVEYNGTCTIGESHDFGPYAEWIIQLLEKWHVGWPKLSCSPSRLRPKLSRSLKSGWIPKMG